MNSIFKSCYATLRILRKIRNFTDFKLRKHLGETLILSKISYCDIALILYRSSSQPDYKGSSSLSLVFFLTTYVNSIIHYFKSWLATYSGP